MGVECIVYLNLTKTYFFVGPITILNIEFIGNLQKSRCW